jgi:hypothetical protein
MDLSAITPTTDKWGAVNEDWADYLARAKPALPTFPDEVLRQWFFEHPHAAEDWAWLGYPHLTFETRRLSLAQIVSSDFGDDGCVRTFRENFERSPRAAFPECDRIAAFVRRNGTWPVAPVFLDNPFGTIASDGGWRCTAPLQLLEGHHRLAVMQSLANTTTLDPSHEIWVVLRPKQSIRPRA